MDNRAFVCDDSPTSSSSPGNIIPEQLLLTGTFNRTSICLYEALLVQKSSWITDNMSHFGTLFLKTSDFKVLHFPL